MKKLFKKKKKGFTLVELLVVIAVLGIMAGIGLNSMSGITDIFRKRADDKTLDQVARTIQIRLMAGDNKLLPSSSNSNLEYTMDIIPELNFYSQYTSNLMRARATGYENLAGGSEVDARNVRLHIDFYSDSEDNSKHYKRSAIISSYDIVWGDEDSQSNNGSGNTGNGENIINHNSYFESSSNLRFEGSEDISNYWFNQIAPFSTKMDEAPEDEVSVYLRRIVFDPDGLDKIIETTDDEDKKNLAIFKKEEMDKVYEKTTPEDIMLSNLQVKNAIDGFYKKYKNGNISDYIQNISDNQQTIENRTFYTIQTQNLDFVDSNNTLVSPVTGKNYNFKACATTKNDSTIQYSFEFTSQADNGLVTYHSAHFDGDKIFWETSISDFSSMLWDDL